MASRRDELNAYTFAKRRTLASFLQPSPSGSEEGAPKPLSALVPGLVVGAVVLAVFGAVGMFSPTAPKGWDEPEEHVIVASKSTTRYVVLKTGKQTQLHPVLNMASAKLLLDPSKASVITVDEKVLDSGKPPHGATIGIPYAPDRLPSSDEASAAKRWAVCERPGDGGRAIQKAAFVLAKKEWSKTEGSAELTGGDLMYVVGPDGKTQYVVDAQGTAYEIQKSAGADNRELLRALDTQGRAPQRVSQEWLDTLHKGSPIAIPPIQGTPGQKANASSLLGEYDKVGEVVKAYDGQTMRYYVVLQGKVAGISEFTATLLLNSGALGGTGQAGEAQQVSPASVADSTPFSEQKNWPTGKPRMVNDGSHTTSGRNTVCNVLNSVANDGSTTLSTWVGTDFPAQLPTGSSSAYATPGSGQLYRQFQGTETSVGGVFLVTDTGLRYALQSNSDSATDDKGIGTSAHQRKDELSEAKIAQIRLGYEKVTPAPIPMAWSTFLPTGPRLSEAAARQPQGS
ncbi:type VII secretion protein EccB [Streptomyces griseochromogenes]|uniref:Type VII secretion protein EccB n=1 Tax=Streptomyces griseochromogenes TaxID=68214 RepID=A0A1B1ATC3_9ACTN|nr:type VII secretion protein EccB [Streptomyces griseochromogenes]ANP49838.1 type VII secretion protein EccB [Streptomyces griseochromogenes]MBP2051669.1 type VII secretion protein EccB [Streptomyces griseochromogenes]